MLLDNFARWVYTTNRNKGATGKQAASLKSYKEVTAILGKMGRLLLFVATSLKEQANNAYYENTQLNEIRISNHTACPPFLASGGNKKRFTPCKCRKTKYREAARLPFIGSTGNSIAHILSNCNRKWQKAHVQKNKRPFCCLTILRVWFILQIETRVLPANRQPP